MTESSEHFLPPEVAAKFLAASHRLNLTPGQELFGLGSAPQAMFGLISGSVQVSVFSDTGHRFLAAQLARGHWFGEVPLLDVAARAFHVEALEATEVAVLSAGAFWDIINNDPSTLLAVTRLVCKRYRSALGWIEDACLKPLPARLAARLLALAAEGRGVAGVVGLSQEALAFQLGVARQTVNKQLKLWEREGLVQLQYATVRLCTLRGWLHDIVDVPRAFAGNTTKELFERWEKALIEMGSSEQQEAYLALRRQSIEYRSRPMRFSLTEKSTGASERLWAQVNKANQGFKDTLCGELLTEYAEFAEHHLLESARMRDDNRRPSEVDHGPVRQWICERAHQLGWTEELFENFERSRHISHDRMGRHRVERIGKKYQYIALAEATARMTDNLAMCSWQDDGKLRAFEPGPRGRDMKRDLDPSLLVRGTQQTGWESTPVTWWTPSAPRLPSGDTDLLLAWLHVESDLCNDIGEIEVVSPDGARWLTMYGFRRWTVPGQSRRNHADVWSRISCLVTALGSGPQLAKELLGRHRGDVSRFWESGTLDLFLGEHGWRDTREVELKRNISAGIKTPYAGIDTSLDAEGSGKDNSVTEGFLLSLPSSGVIKVLDLHLRSGRTPEYVDAGGTLRWQDPSLRSRGSGAGVVSRDYFLSKLASAGLEPVWVLAGEKNVYAGRDLGASMGYGGGLYYTTAFVVEASVLKSFGTRIEFHAPSADQLEGLKSR